MKEEVQPLTDDSWGQDQMQIIRLVLGACFTNCYLVYHPRTRNCMIIDPADEGEKIISCIEKNHLHPVYIVITHGHTDHVLAAAELAERYHALVAVSKIDAWRLMDEDLINDRPYVDKPYRPVRPSILLSEGDELWLDGHSVHHHDFARSYARFHGPSHGSGDFYRGYHAGRRPWKKPVFMAAMKRR